LRGKVLLPIHNGTFDLSLHAWHDPFDRITELAGERRLPLATPEIGQAMDIRLPMADGKWWERVKEMEAAALAAA
jgi:hypothetical protein